MEAIGIKAADTQTEGRSPHAKRHRLWENPSGFGGRAGLSVVLNLNRDFSGRGGKGTDTCTAPGAGGWL